MDRFEFDGGDTEISEMFDDRIRCEPRIGSTQRFGKQRMKLREALHMQFINNGFVQRRARGAVVAPGKRGINHLRQRRVGRAVPFIEGEISFGIVQTVRKHFIGPFHIAADAFGIGI